MQGITEEMRNEHRQQLLSVDRAAVIRVANKYLLSALNNNNMAVSIVGPGDGIKHENTRKYLEDQGYICQALQG